MSNLDTLREEDKNLTEMFKADTAKGGMSAEDVAAYNELIESQRAGFQETLFVKKDEHGNTIADVAPSIGDAALHNASLNDQIYNHSEDWRTPKS